MKIRFVLEGQGLLEGVNTLAAEFDVAKKPTKEESDAIYEYINRKLEKLYDSDVEIGEIDYEKICRTACKKYIKTLRNPVVQTFYI